MQSVAMQSVASTTVTREESITLVKNMFRISVSSICYHRGLFPPQFFKSKTYGQVQIQQLQGAERLRDGDYKVDNEEAYLVTKWLEKGVFKALDSQYVSSMIFAIYASDPQNESGRLLETYEFKVAYQNGSSAAKVNEVEMYSKESVKAQAAKFIRSLMEFSSTLDPLPQDRWVQLQLTYTEKAPADYEPEFFGPALKSIMHGRTFPLRVKIGNLRTKDMDLSVQFAGLEHLLFQEVIKDMDLNDNKKVFQGATHLPADAAAPEPIAVQPAEPILVNRVAEEETKVSQSAVEASRKEEQTNALEKLGADYHSPSEVYVLVRDHVLQNKRPVISKCAKELEIDTNDVKTAFQSLVEDGLLIKSAHKYQMSRKSLPRLDKSHAKKAPGLKHAADDDTTDADENENRMNVETGPSYETPKGKQPTGVTQPAAQPLQPPPEPRQAHVPNVPGDIQLSQMSDAEYNRQRKFSTLKEPLHLQGNKKARHF